MVKQEKFFPSQEKEEKVFLLIRKHWFNYVVFFLLDFLSIIPIVAYIYSWYVHPEMILSIAGGVFTVFLSLFILLILAVQLYGFVDYYLDVYIITDQRIVDISQDGFFKRQISELHLHQVQDVNADVEGIWSTFLHFGDVRIQTAGERENFIFKSIPHPYSVAKQIVDLHQQHVEKKPKGKILKNNDTPHNYEEDNGLPYADKGLKLSSNVKIVSSSQKMELEISKVEDVKSDGSTKVTRAKKSNPAVYEGELYEGREVDL
jgi:membrane protein YdbS with pleckstrin-like domain